MSKNLKWIIGILVFIIVLLFILTKTGVIKSDNGTKVTAEKAAVRNITETVTASGKVYPEIEVKITPDISGQIVDLEVAEGDTVHKGQMLAKIYADIYSSQRDQAAAVVSQSEAQVANSTAQLGALKATLDQTEAAYNRQKTLLDQKVISQSEFETAQQAYQSAKANFAAAQSGIKANQASVNNAMAGLSTANKDLQKATLVAPMDGVVSLLSVKKGERVAGNSFNVGTEIMRIADLSSIEVQVDVGENDIPKVKLGDTANVQVDAFNNRKFKGVVYKIANPETSLLSGSGSSSSNSSTSVTNYEVHIRLLPSGYKDLIVKGQPFPFRPEMTASADIQTQTKTNVLSVPLNAVTTRKFSDVKKADSVKAKAYLSTLQNTDNNSDSDIVEAVFLIQQDKKVKLLPVKTSIQDITYIEIINGLKAGDDVVTGPYDVVSKTMKNGNKIKIVTKDELIKTFEKKQ